MSLRRVVGFHGVTPEALKRGLIVEGYGAGAGRRLVIGRAPVAPADCDHALGDGTDLIEEAHRILGTPRITMRDGNVRLAMMEWGAHVLRVVDQRARTSDGDAEVNRAWDLSTKIVALGLMQAAGGVDGLVEKVATAVAHWSVLIASQWAVNAFPVLAPSHRLAASLMATGMSREHVPDLAMPWSTFLVSVPDGMFPTLGQMLGEKDRDCPLRFVGLLRVPETAPVAGGAYEAVFGGQVRPIGGSFVIFTVHAGVGVTSTYVVDSIADLASLELTSKEQDGPRPGLVRRGQLTAVEIDLEKRFARLLGRLLLGCLVEIDQPDRRAEVAAGGKQRRPKAASKASSRADLPKAWVFELRRDVTVDCRPWVRSHLEGSGSGRGKALLVQTLVRGHWQRYHTRAGIIWKQKEPKWRGPEGAPIAVHGRKLNGDGS